MNDFTGHPFITLPDDVADHSWHSLVTQKSAKGLPVKTVVRLFICDEFDIQGRIPLNALFRNFAYGCFLIRARSFFLKAILLLMEMHVYCGFHSVEKAVIKHLAWDGKQRDSR
ncbi:hypothetical protein DPMN_179076 [Dreissena polymorpha]|uniref:Uncharacterized protein n=1 Tax=Dreissena polymorpha TaxID=45954 RepID=A0A9D4EE34_DREPO|nr:hypothetical protein DPMN_179076 [Dreissena polymorpha]